MTNERLDSAGTIIILVLTFLLPIFFIPLLSVPLFETKLFLLVAGVFLSVLLWTIARLKGNDITIPQEKFVIPLISLPFIALIASLFSGDIFHSLVGQSFEIDTVIMILVLTLGFGAGIYLFNSKDKVIKFYLVLIASSLILFLYQIAKILFGGDFLSFNLFFGNTANLIGKWNDVAIFAGLITLLSLITLDILRPKGLLKIVFYASFIGSLIMLVIVNFSLVWFVLGFISFLLFIRSFLENKFFARLREGGETPTSSRGKISGFVLFVLVLSILFIFAGSIFGGFINNQFGISQIEARPSWQSTMTITEEVYSNNILFGAGPNNFTKEWLLNKPASVNNTLFWDVDFLFGVGIIPTLFITHGLLSVIAWLVFFALFFWAGIRTFVRLDVRPFENYLSTSSFFSASFLWLMSIFYVPHITLFFFAFLFSGIFLATQVQAGIVKQKTLAFNENLRVGFIGIILIFTLLLVSVAGLYVSIQKFISAVYIQRASVEVNLNGDIEKAEESIAQALVFNNRNDLVHRVSTGVSIFRLTNLINQGENTTETQQQFQDILVQAIESGRLAIAADDRNYQNWATLGRVYEILIPLGIEGAYDNARVSYERAFSLNPQNPRLALNLARTEVLGGNNDIAREFIGNALVIKNDYTDAIFLLSQIEINEGKVSQAIVSIEAATFLTPRDPLAFFQLGILKYSAQDYEGAIVALERAVLLNNQYANARYFLGLSYYQLNRIEDAINQFSIVRDLNSSNVEAIIIIENLKAGRAPFENFAPPTDPFEGFGLPVEE